MDLSISLITTGHWFRKGAKAFEDGAGIDDHDLNHDASALRDWKAGYRAQKGHQMRAGLVKVVPQQLAEVSPP